LIPTDNLN